jgi:hypothetical protein
MLPATTPPYSSSTSTWFTQSHHDQDEIVIVVSYAAIDQKPRQTAPIGGRHLRRHSCHLAWHPARGSPMSTLARNVLAPVGLISFR